MENEYKGIKESVKAVNEIMGFNVLDRETSRKYAYPRWTLWLMLRSNGYSKYRIAAETGYHRSSVAHGIRGIKALVIRKDEYAIECYNKIKDYVDRQAESR